MRNIVCIAAAAALLAAAPGPARADGSDSDSLSDSRIKLLRYDESDVYTIATRYGYQTNIVFGQGEEIQTISVGDRSLWQIIPTGNRLFIRPMEEDVTTNMTVLTNRHSYQFDLKSIAGDRTSGNIYVAKFTYPEDRKKSAPAQPAPIPPGLAAAAAANLMSSPASVPTPPAPHPAIAHYAPPAAPAPLYPNYNYTYAGPDAAAPLQVYDDGKSTIIEYGADQPPPAIYLVSGGKMQPVSYTVKGNRMVVPQVAGELVLESNAGTVHVYNEMLNAK